MTTAKWRALRLSSEGWSTCQDLRRLKARIADARHGARNPKQTSTAHQLVCYALKAHLTNPDSQTHGIHLARNGPRAVC